MTIDSSPLINELSRAGLCFEAPSTYSSSSGGEASYSWIQRAISYLVLNPHGFLLDGLYVQTMHPEIDSIIESDLDREFEAWEALSDEALALFEAECD